MALGAFWASKAKPVVRNHNVTARYELTVKTTDLEVLRLAGALSPGDSENSQKAPSPSPCTGAMCSGLPASAPAPLSTGPAADDSEWALGAVRVAPTCPGTFDRPRENGTLRSIDRSRSIFHPPRTHVVPTSF